MAGGSWAVALLNRGGGPANRSLALADLALAAEQDNDDRALAGGGQTAAVAAAAAAAQSFAVRDVWAHTDNGTVAAATGVLTALVGKQDVVMLVLTPSPHA